MAWSPSALQRRITWVLQPGDYAAFNSNQSCDTTIAQVAGGTFEGPRLKGKVLPGGGDWLLLRRDGVLQLDVRLTLETDDKQMIYMTYKGFRHGPKDVIDRLNRGEAVDAGLYYFRTTPYFETSSDKYAWMNSICCVASGSRSAAGPTYHVFQVL
jgi:hypothetical protein